MVVYQFTSYAFVSAAAIKANYGDERNKMQHHSLMVVLATQHPHDDQFTSRILCVRYRPLFTSSRRDTGTKRDITIVRNDPWNYVRAEMPSS